MGLWCSGASLPAYLALKLALMVFAGCLLGDVGIKEVALVACLPPLDYDLQDTVAIR